MHERKQVSTTLDGGCVEAPGAVEAKETLADATGGVVRRTAWRGRPVRALDPLAADDLDPFAAVNSGGFVIPGFHNQGIQQLGAIAPSRSEPTGSERLHPIRGRFFLGNRFVGRVRCGPNGDSDRRSGGRTNRPDPSTLKLDHFNEPKSFRSGNQCNSRSQNPKAPPFCTTPNRLA
jgi:hypothetical protein